MENARVAIVEDMEKIRQMVRLSLIGDGHNVVAEATNLEEAFSLVDKLAQGEIEADVVLLDGNLGDKTEEKEYKPHDDARQILARIREAGIASTVIGFSADYLREAGIDVDADTAKSIEAVIETIDAL